MLHVNVFLFFKIIENSIFFNIYLYQGFVKYTHPVCKYRNVVL